RAEEDRGIREAESQVHQSVIRIVQEVWESQFRQRRHQAVSAPLSRAPEIVVSPLAVFQNRESVEGLPRNPGALLLKGTAFGYCCRKQARTKGVGNRKSLKSLLHGMSSYRIFRRFPPVLLLCSSPASFSF